jgi:Arc/MetJ-type ribon-helix-helix transcriptional regulator
MSKSMISIRIPVSLVEELKLVSKKDHFMDVSEAVRSIIRDNYLKQKDPFSHELTKIREEISQSLEQKSQDELLFELKKIKRLLEKDE